MFDLSGPPKFTFGKHKGETIEDVAFSDDQYLFWVIEQEWVDDNFKSEVNELIKKEGLRHEPNCPVCGAEYEMPCGCYEEIHYK